LLGELLAEVGLEGIMDVHVHPLPMLDEGELLREVRVARVRRCVLLALDVDPEELEDKRKRAKFMEKLLSAGVWSLQALESARELLKLARTTNEHVADIVRRHPSLFLGFGSVNPSKPASYVDEKLAEISDLGLVGVKLIPTLQLFCPDKARKNLNKILRFCEREAMVVMFHTGCDPGPWESPALSACAKPSALAPLVRKFNRVEFILAHAGSYSARVPGIWFHEAVELTSKRANVWLDVAAVPYVLAEGDFVEALRARGLIERVLFGSDYPVVGSSGIADAASVVLASTELTADEKAAVMSLNAERLLGT